MGIRRGKRGLTQRAQRKRAEVAEKRDPGARSREGYGGA